MSDRISNLPDSLLLHTLSSNSLETKDVVATSLLSKRWRSLWHSIPKLEFHDNFHIYKSFLQFVDATLNLVDPKSLRMFSLQCEDFGAYPTRCDAWVNKVLDSKLEYLNLCLAPCYDSLVGLPLPSIFRSNTIRILKLVGVNLSNLSTVHLPSLKTLHLMNVQFPKAENLEMLLSKCVHLQELLLLSVEFDDYDAMKLESGMLHHLVIAEVSVDLAPLKAFSNVTFLSLKEALDGESTWLVESNPDPDDDDIPPCVLSNLKTFALGGFECLQIEFGIVKFILKYAEVLRSIIIWTVDVYHPCREAKGLELLRLLSSYPKCSQNCRAFVDVPATSLFQSVRSKLRSDKDFNYYFQD